MIAYLAGVIGGAKTGGPIAPPVVYPKHGFYHPDAPKLFETRAEFLAWYAGRKSGHAYDPKAQSVGLSELAYYRQQSVGALDAMIREIESARANAITLLRRGSVDFSQLIGPEGPIVDALLYHGEILALKNREDGLVQAHHRLGVPILQALAADKASADRASPGGLAPELTPFVVNAERDEILEPIVVAAADKNAGASRATPMFSQAPGAYSPSIQFLAKSGEQRGDASRKAPPRWRTHAPPHE